MMGCFRSQIGGVRLLLRFVQSNMDSLFTNRNLCAPLGGRFIPRYANQFRTTVDVPMLAVTLVSGLSHIAQILNTVIKPVSVYVVNLLSRPNSMNVKPCQPVGSIQSVVDANVSVSLGIDASSNVPNFYVSTGFRPSENTGNRIVIKKRSEFGYVHA